MTVRSLSVASLAAVVLLSPSAPSAPVTTKYKVEVATEQVVDLSGVGQGEQRTTVNLVAHLSVSLNDTAGGKLVHAVIDSIHLDSPAIPASAADSVKGGWVHGFLPTGGRLTQIKTSMDSNRTMGQARQLVRALFPRIKAGLKTGDQWIDTSQVSDSTSDQKITTKTVTNYTAGGQQSVAGVPATKIESAFTSSSAGTMENPMAGTMDMEGTEEGKASFFVGADGRFLGGTTSATGKTIVKVAMMPDPIPVKITRSVTVSVVQ